MPQSTLSGLVWWQDVFGRRVSLNLRASLVAAEAKSPIRESGHVAEQAAPFELDHMRQCESVAAHVSLPAHRGMAGWVANLAHAGLRGEDSQRHRPRSGGLNADVLFGTCRNPKPHGIEHMQWVALRSGVLDEDWGLQAWQCLFEEVHTRGLDFTLPKPSKDMTSFNWDQFADKHDQMAVVRFVLMHPEGCCPFRHRRFVPLHHIRYDSCGSSFGFNEDERRHLGNWAKGSRMPQRYDASVCGEQLTRMAELLGLLRACWRPPPAREAGLPRAPCGDAGVPRTPSGGCVIGWVARGPKNCVFGVKIQTSLNKSILERFSKNLLKYQKQFTPKRRFFEG